MGSNPEQPAKAPIAPDKSADTVAMVTPPVTTTPAPTNSVQTSPATDQCRAVPVITAATLAAQASSTVTPAIMSSQPAPSPPSEATPSPREAARWLNLFKNKVQVKWPSPILKEPPKPKEFPRKPLVPVRSRRIAAQQLDHVPTSKRGEVLLMRRLGTLPANGQPTSASRRHFDKLFIDLSNSESEAFDELFLVTRKRGGRVAWRTQAIMV